MNVTSQQAAIIESIIARENVMVNACPGSGKTSTMVEAVRQMQRAVITGKMAHRKVVYATFSAKMADEAKRKFPSGVTASTFHAWCGRLISEHLPHVKRFGKGLPSWRNFARAAIGYDPKERGVTKEEKADIHQRKLIAKCIETIGDMACNMAWFDGSPQTYTEVASYTNKLEYAQDVIEASWGLWEDAYLRYYAAVMAGTAIADFNISIALIAQNEIVERNIVLILDEAQDLNPQMLMVVHNHLAAGCQVVMVGEDLQSIFAFRGGIPGLMEKYGNIFRMHIMELSVTHRYGQAVCDFLSHIKPTTSAAHHETEIVTPEDVEQGYNHLINQTGSRVVIARTNAGLIGAFITLRRMGIPIAMQTDRAAEKLMTFWTSVVKAAQGDSDMLPPMVDIVTVLRGRLSSKSNATKEMAQAIIDLLADGQVTISQVDTVLSEMYQAESGATCPHCLHRMYTGPFGSKVKCINKECKGNGVYVEMKRKPLRGDEIILATVHGSKGLEYDHVMVIGDFPSLMELTDKTDRIQEMNMFWVAVSRCRYTLIIACRYVRLSTAENIKRYIETGK